MSKRTSSFRRLGIRNLKSAGSSAVKFTGNAASKTAVGLFKYAATDHLGMADSLGRMPKMGAWESLKYTLWMFLIRIFAIGITAVIFFVVIVFVASLS